MATESFIQFIWKHRLYSGESLITTCGQNLEVENPGEQNFHAGPDFFNARIKLDQLVWAGNVEVHRRASDWYKHRHHQDPAYDNVILHVVFHFDLHIKNSKDRSIPTLIIDPLSKQISQLEDLSKSENWLLCHPYIHNISPKIMQDWYRLLYEERLNQKVQHMNQIINRYRDDREKALLIAMASGFGLPINRLPFEMMASRIPLSLLWEIKDCPADVEALLFGQSGLLFAPSDQGSYAISMLQRHMQLTKNTLSNPLPSHLWKFLRIRPASFPTLRLSQFASLIHIHFPLYEKFMNYEAITGIEQGLDLKASSYWNTHYTFRKSSPSEVKKMGRQSILNLSINVLIPFMEAIQRTDRECHFQIDSKRILEKLNAESNHIIKKWSIFGIKPSNALESQALIQLYTGYCKQKRCFNCQIGKVTPSYNP